MKGRRFFLGLSFFCFLGSGLWAESVEIFCDDDYKPYSYKEEGAAKGIYVDVLTEVFSRIEGYEVKITPVPWKRGLVMMEKGTGFALFPPYYFPKKRPYMDYSLPILEEKNVVFVPPGTANPRSIPWPRGFFGKRIGQNAGFELGGAAYQAAVDQGRITEDQASGNEANIQKLAQSRIDGYVQDRLSVLWTMKQMKKNDDYVGRDILEGPTVTVETGRLGITNQGNRYPFGKDFMDQFNRVLQKMLDSGEVEQIVNRYIE